MQTTPRPMYEPSRMLEPPGTMRIPSAGVIARTGYVDLSMNGWRARRWTCRRPRPCETRAGFLFSPKHSRASPSAKRHPAPPRALRRDSAASLNSRKSSKCSSVYCAGGASNSFSICSGSMNCFMRWREPRHGTHARSRWNSTARATPARHESALRFSAFGATSGKPPHRLQQTHFRHRRFHGNGIRLHEVYLHQRMHAAVNLARRLEIARRARGA